MTGAKDVKKGDQPAAAPLQYRAREYPAAIEALTKAVKAPESNITYKEAVQILGLHNGQQLHSGRRTG